MKRVLGLLITGAVAFTPVVLTAPTALGVGTQGTVQTSTMKAQPNWPKKWTLRTPLFREVARYGASDPSPSSIDHVYELQYRLRWAGVYDGPVSGTFGKLTRSAVKKYQGQHKLGATGIANHRTWSTLLRDTIRHRKAIPAKCTNGQGWHICYDRSQHQITLWHGGSLVNSWLVRGGDYSYKTRTGNFHVFSRDRDHVSGIYGSPMPYSQFFSGGQAFHGSSYMTDPFVDHSHGCVNMYIEDAKQLWLLTSKVRLNVHVYGAWD